jgi:peptide/nickel transport system permease protein
MLRYAIRKVLLAIPLVIGVITLIFILLELSPGDISDKYFNQDTTAEMQDQIRALYGLDEPVLVRYLITLRNVLTFNFGVSMSSNVDVLELIRDRLPNTLLLSGVSLLVIFPAGITIGTIQAVRRGHVIDTSMSLVSLFFYAMPSFWLALMLQLILGYHFGMWWAAIDWPLWAREMPGFDIFSEFFNFPISAMKDANNYDYMTPTQKFVDRLQHVLLPGIAMGLASAAGTARYMRSSLLEVMNQDYIRTARAKGLREFTVVTRHGLRNALLPIITLFGLSVPFLFSGSVLVEYQFSWPGMGRLIVTAIQQQDTPLIIACFYIFTLLVVAGNLLADLMYATVDPRIRYDE